MSAKRDYYEILGISRNADESQIKKAYRKLAKKYHPDTNAGNADAEQKFKEITEAYDVLGNKEKKKMYDRFGHAAFDQTAGDGAAYGSYGSGFGQNYGGSGGTYQEFRFEGGDMDDIFGDIFGGMFRQHTGQQDAFRERSGFGGFHGGTFPQRGRDAHAQVTVSFDEAVFGCDKVIRIQDPSDPQGKMQSLQVHIPAGIDTGKSVRLKGKGMPGMQGGEAGDLFLEVTVMPKEGYERKGTDVYSTVRIPFTTAVLGGETAVRTLYGTVLCKIKRGTQSGTKIRLKGKGIPSLSNPSVHGDHYVTVQISVPRQLSPEAEKKLREYEAACDGRAQTA